MAEVVWVIIAHLRTQQHRYSNGNGNFLSTPPHSSETETQLVSFHASTILLFSQKTLNLFRIVSKYHREATISFAEKIHH